MLSAEGFSKWERFLGHSVTLVPILARHPAKYDLLSQIRPVCFDFTEPAEHCAKLKGNSVMSSRR